MIYRVGGLDLFKPIASFLGGFALVRLSGAGLEITLGQAIDDSGGVAFTTAFSKRI